MTKEISECRVCKESLKDVVDLGSIYPSGFKSVDDKSEDVKKVPLVLCECQTCGLIQLRHSVDLDLMYRQYWYSSSLNKSMVSSLQDVVDDIENKIDLFVKDTIVDIGCNDGTMLSLYSNKHLYKVGYDPALNLKRPDCFTFINDYFSPESYFDEYGHMEAKVVTAIAMFYDLPDPVEFTKGVASILHEDGIFVIQFTDLLSMFKLTAFDNICHEHLEYYRLKDIHYILEMCGLEIIDVSYNDVNGGSVRVTAGHKGKLYVSESVQKSLDEEEKFFSDYTVNDFVTAINYIKHKVHDFLKWADEMDKDVFLLGASTKGNTLLQVCGIDSSTVPYAAEVNSDKFGLKTIGSNIKIISEKEALDKDPDYFFVPIWHFKKSILSNKNIINYLNRGGNLLFPLPQFVEVCIGPDGIEEYKV